VIGAKGSADKHQGQRVTPRKKAEDMTAPERQAEISKSPLREGRRPDRTGYQLHN
jgi:hypothetical protein